MATGSGKTLVMVGLMLYLYEKGFRNFCFSLTQTTSSRKTKDNFLNPQASKYLFNDKIVIDGKEVYIKETDTFESADDKNINIKFTTIQQLHDFKQHQRKQRYLRRFQGQKMVL
ncbi:MAG: DEAD/DEAH box helicase family protein [Saprospiraceae bacterium]|nr:DEAD/DEAH box helicase family protein [Saprospiraceae bacterium]